MNTVSYHHKSYVFLNEKASNILCFPIVNKFYEDLTQQLMTLIPNAFIVKA